MGGSRAKSKPKSKARKAVRKPHSDSGTGRAGAHRSGQSAGSRPGPFYASGPVFSLGAPVQKKLVIGRANDPYEREADAVAEQVMSGRPVQAISSLGPGGLGGVSQRQEEDTEELLQETRAQRQEEEEESIQTQEAGPSVRGESASESAGKSTREREIEEGERRLDEIEEKADQLEEGVGRAKEQLEELRQRIAVREKRRALTAKVETFDPDKPGKTFEEVNNDIVDILDDCRDLQLWGDDEATDQAMTSMARKLIPGINRAADEFKRTRSYDSALKLVKNIERYQYLGGEGLEGGVLNEAIEILQRQQEIQPKVTVQRQTSKEAGEPFHKLDSQASGEREVPSGAEMAIQHARGGGRPLERGIKAQMESAFGATFGGVRMHDDVNADSLTRQLNARAFTIGQDIFFRQGVYSPGSSRGRELLAHELTHVMQQEGGFDKLRMQEDPKPEKREYGEEFEELARLLRDAMEGLGTDEEKVFEVLQKVHGRSLAIESLKKAYRDICGTSIESDLRSEMSGSELDFALTLLGKKPPSKDVEIKSRTFKTADYTQAVTRLKDAMMGAGTDEEAIYAILTPFAGAFDSIRQLKATYKNDVGHSLEGDLRDEMSGDELEYALKLLHAPVEPAKGIPERLVVEAEQGNVGEGPGGPCTAVTFKRFVRACISSRLGVKSLDEADKDSLNKLLGKDLAAHYSDGGPPTKPLEEGSQAQKDAASIHLYNDILIPTLRKLGLGDKVRQYMYLWNIRPEKLEEGWLTEGEEVHHGAVAALEKRGLAEGIKDQDNIKGILWNEILQPGDVIQTWENTNFTGKGHSFIFLEYVYSPEASPPKHRPSLWVLYGSSGRPIDTDGNEVTERQAVKQTYAVKPGEVDEIVLEKCGFATMEECRAMNKGNPEFKRTKDKKYFRIGAEIITKMGETKARTLEQMKNLQLVGMRITDQRGFVFIPRNQTHTAKDAEVILNDTKRKRAKWIGESALWVAARLA